MPFREKLKRAFGRTSSTTPSPTDPSSSSTLTTVSSKSSSRKFKKNKKPPITTSDPDRYRPGEVMPKPKYRGPINKQHQEKLLAFSFSGALGNIRRKSATSQYSPMGSRMPSRAASRASVRKSLGGRPKSRQASRVGGSVDVDGLEENGEGDDDVRKVGLSRHHTHEIQPPRTAGSEGDDESLATTKTVTNGDSGRPGYNKPFTEDELTLALTKSTLKPAMTERA